MSSSRPIRVYHRLLDPREHPDYSRRPVRPPTWEVFGNRTQFTCLRGFEEKDGRLTGIAEELERYTRTHALGTVIWPSYPVLFATNLDELADEIKKRGLYLFDIWGYVPGSGPGGYWQQFKVPSAALALLEEKLGDRWFGTDLGEQDGRYLNGYAHQMQPASTDRVAQYRNFQRHFERMGDDLGHRHAALVSLNFGHYLLREGTCTLIGAETAQALPNNQVYYAFIRGAGKQYGVPWFGNASVYNRWGYKSYGTEGQESYGHYGPTKGASLSLLRRLLYSHLLYNGMIAGFENFWIENGQLTPIGAMQQAAQRWIRQHGQPGVMHTPVGLLLDFHAGWTFPRHLYSNQVFRVWGNLPYAEGDYLTDAVLELLYPGYRDASYFHDERGFIAPTPFGDIADCLLSDAEGWLLARYPVLVAAGELTGGAELQDKLEAYVAHGGHLVITAGNWAKLPGGLGRRKMPMKDATLRLGRGRITFFADAFGLEAVRPAPVLRNETDQPLRSPRKLRDSVRRGLSRIFTGQQLFVVKGENLSVVTCRQSPGTYTISLTNNHWAASKFGLVSRCGRILSCEELPLDPAALSAVGWSPECVDGTAGQAQRPDEIGGGDVRIFLVRVKESGLRELPHRLPPSRMPGRLLALRSARSIKEEILARPTFAAHFDGVVIDWRYVHDRESESIRAEAGWIRRQGLRVVVDLVSGLNYYPGLRLVRNIAAEHKASMETIGRVMAKMPLLGARDLLLALHRYPENNQTPAQADEDFVASISELAEQAGMLGLTLHLRLAPERPPISLEAARLFQAKVGASNVRLAPSVGLLPADVPVPVDMLGFWLVGAPTRDLTGALCDVQAPLHVASASAKRQWLQLLAKAPAVPMVLDANMPRLTKNTGRSGSWSA